MLNIVDVFGEHFQFNVSGESCYRSYMSVSLSFTLIIFTLIYSVINAISLLTRQHLSINSFQTIIHPQDVVILNETDVFLGFSVLNMSSQEYIPLSDDTSKLLTFNSTLIKKFTQNHSVIRESKNLELSGCENIIDTVFLLKNTGLNPQYCFNFNGIEVLGNHFTFHNNSFINLKIKGDGVNQKSRSFYDPLHIVLHYPIVYFDLENYSHPFSIDIGVADFKINFNKSKKQEISFNLYEIFTDFKYIGSEYIFEQILTTDYNFKDSLEDISRDSIFELDLIINPVKTKYFRSYLKFQECLNNVSADCVILFNVLGAFCRWYNSTKIKQSFLKKYVLLRKRNFAENEEETVDVNNNSKSQIKKNNLPPDTNHSDHKQELARQYTIRQVLGRRKRRNNRIHENSLFINKNLEEPVFDNLIWDHLRNMVCPMKQSYKEKRELYEFCYKFYEHLVDINRVLLNIEHFEDLKKIILNKDQNLLLNNSKLILDISSRNLNKKVSEGEIINSINILVRKNRKKKKRKINLMVLNKFL